jgi:hypothetical protein
VLRVLVQDQFKLQTGTSNGIAVAPCPSEIKSAHLLNLVMRPREDYGSNQWFYFENQFDGALLLAHGEAPTRFQDQLACCTPKTYASRTTPCAATTRLRPHALYVNLAVGRNYSSPAARALRRPRRALRLLVSSRTRSTSTSSCTASTRLHSPGCSDLPRFRRASGCLGTSRGSSCGPSRGSSSTTPPPPCIRVPRHVARLVVDYFSSAARPGASAHRAARHAARRATRRRLLRLRRASGCLDTSCGSSRG